MKSTKVQTLGIPTRMCDISTDNVLCRRLHINLNQLAVWYKNYDMCLMYE